MWDWGGSGKKITYDEQDQRRRTKNIAFHTCFLVYFDGHGGALGGRVSAQGVAVFLLDVRVGWVHLHVQQWVPVGQEVVIKEAAEQLVGEVLHLLREVLQNKITNKTFLTSDRL